MRGAGQQVIILFGPPGVGKGAQAEVLSARRGLTHLSTGDVLRDEIGRGTVLGQRVKETIEKGRFVDDETAIRIVLGRLERPECAKGVVLDGFPRNLAQAERLDDLLKARGQEVDRAVLINATEATVLKRLAGRQVCARCQRTYHDEFKPPRAPGLCDGCGGPVAPRPDDDPAARRERVRVYQECTRPLVDYYRKSLRLAEIDGEGAVTEVAARIEAALAGPPR